MLDRLSRLPRPAVSFRVGFRPGPMVWALVPVLVILVVWQQASVDRLVVSLDEERETHRELESQVNALRLEASRLSSLRQVEARAERELGLERPDTRQIVDLVFEDSGDGPRFALASWVGEAVAGTPEDSEQ